MKKKVFATMNKMSSFIDFELIITETSVPLEWNIIKIVVESEETGEVRKFNVLKCT